MQKDLQDKFSEHFARVSYDLGRKQGSFDLLLDQTFNIPRVVAELEKLGCSVRVEGYQLFVVVDPGLL